MKALRVRLPRFTRERSKLFFLLALFMAGSVFSILTSLIAPVPANAITDSQKDYCVANYPKDKQVATAVGTNADWTQNQCDQICTTRQTTSTGITYSTGCDRNKVASETTPDAATYGILKDKYGNSAVTGYCGSDKACITQWQSKIRDRMATCVEKYNYDENNKTVFPDMDTSVLAGCVSDGLGFNSTKEKAIKEQLDKDHDAITAEAQNSSNAKTKDDCEAQSGYTWNEDTSECEAPEGQTTCAIEGVGWFICPAMTLMAQLNDAAYGFLASHFLSVDLDLNEASSPVRDAWAKFRDVANVLFVIAFLFVVYSQLTSVGISNYGIKKMLPKIVVAAILVNMSYLICQLAVDLSNILGYGLSKFFANVTVGTAVTGESSNASVLGNNLSWAIAVGGIVTAGVVGIALGVSMPVLLSALLAIGLIVLILVARQALIILLIAVAPVAFVAYLLPNTEQWFKKWVKMFSTLLLLFPIIALVFGASKLAGNIILSTAVEDPLMQVVALGVSALPFFVVPGLLKGALTAAGSIGNKLQGMGNKATGNLGARLKDSTKLGTGLADMKKYRDQQRNIRYAKSRNKGIMGAIGRTPIIGGKKYAEKTRLRANSLENEEYEEDVKAAGELLKSKTYSEKQDIAAGRVKVSEAERDAAVRFMMSSGNFDERRAVLETASTMTRSQRKSVVEGARSKGDTGVYGSKTLGNIEEGRIDQDGVAKQLARGATDRVEKGEATAETFTRDSYTAQYVADNAKAASAESQQKFAANLSSYASTEAGQKMAIAVRGHLDTVREASADTTRVHDVGQAQTEALAENARRGAAAGGSGAGGSSGGSGTP